MIKKYIFKVTLILIVLLGVFLRLYNLGGSPPSVNWDEAAWGYNAYSVLLTGKDEYGKLLPIFTRSFDEYKSTLPMYLMIPFIKVLGLNVQAVRLPSALLGAASIFLIYLLCKKIFNDEKTALFAAFLFAIEPWAVHFSRVYYDANEALFFLLAGFLLFILSKKRNVFLPFSALAFMISLYTYNSEKVLVPLFIIILVFLNKQELKKYSRKIIYFSTAILVVFIIPFIILAFAGESFARVTYTNIFVLWPTEISPKLYYFIWDVAGRYLAYFSPYNLFLREPQESATIVAGNSIFFPFEFIPLVVGFFYLLRNSKKYKEFLLLLLISPLPATATWNFFQPGRTMSLFACYSILIGVGLSKIFEFIPNFLKNFSYVLLIIFALLNAFYLFDSINVYLLVRDPGNWQSEFRDIVPVVMANTDKYSQVIIDTPQAQPYIFYLFYGKYDPAKYLSELDLNYIGTPRKHYDFGKFHFRKIDWSVDKKLKNTLFVGGSADFPQTKPLIEVKNKTGETEAWIVATN